MLINLDARARRLASAIASNLAGRFAALIAPFIATPAMLGYFGDADFGLWATAVSLTSIAVVADFGIGNGLLTKVASAFGRSDDAAIRRYVSGALLVLGAVASALMLALLLASWALNLEPILTVVFCAFIIGMPGAAFYQLLFAIQRVPTANVIQTIGAALAVLAIYAAIYLKLPPAGVAAAYALPPVLISYAAAGIYFLRNPQHRPQFSGADRSGATELLALGIRFFVLSILTAVALNVDNLIISAVVGTEAVAGYSIPMRLGSLLSLVIMALYMPMWGANGEALARGEHAWVRRNAIRMSLAGGALVLTAGLILIAISDWLIQLWVGRTFENQRLVLAGFVLLSTATALTSPFNMVLNAMSRVSTQIYPWLAALIIGITAKVFVAYYAVWPFAAITGIAYLAIITPVVVMAALKALERPRAFSLRSTAGA